MPKELHTSTTQDSTASHTTAPSSELPKLTDEQREALRGVVAGKERLAEIIWATDSGPSGTPIFAERDLAAVALAIDDLRRERDLLFDALKMHMRSTGIGDKAMAKVDEFRAVIEHSKDKVRGEIDRLTIN